MTTPAVTGKGGTKEKITLQTEDHTRWEVDSIIKYIRYPASEPKKKKVSIGDHAGWEGDLSIGVQSQCGNPKRTSSPQKNKVTQAWDAVIIVLSEQTKQIKGVADTKNV